MILHAEQGIRGTLYDLDTGRPVPKPIWFDTDRGLIEAYHIDSQGQEQTDGNGNYLTYQARGRFKFVPRPVHPTCTKIVMGAPNCARCDSPLTLLGDDLCPACKAKDRGQKHPMKVSPLGVFDMHKCSVSGCSRMALWQVADEVEVTPEEADGSLFGKRVRLWSRGAVVGRRFLCDIHYSAPRLLDPKGEVIKNLEDNNAR